MMPDWIDNKAAKPAVLPASEADVKAAHQTAQGLLNSHARRLMTGDEKWEAQMADQALFFEANLKLSESQKDKHKIQLYASALIHAYTHLGRFEGARQLAAAHNSPTEADSFEQAVNREDSEECECMLTEGVATAAGPQFTTASGVIPRAEVPILHKKWYAADRVWSPKHNKVVTVWRCAICGTMNAHDHIPPGHEAIIEGRINAQKRAGDPDLAHSDHILLRK